MKFSTHIIIVLLLVGILSCKSRKAIEESKLKHLSYKVLSDSLKNNQLHYDWLRTKGSATIHFQDENHSIKTNFRVRKDSAIWNNLSKGPVQISTVLLSQDSVKLLKKIGEKEYFLGNYDYIDQLFKIDMDLELLQDFISGNPIMFDYEEKYNLEIDSGLYLLSSDKSKKIDKLLEKDKYNKKHELLYRCWVNPQNYKCARIEVNFLTNGTTITVNYSDWVSVDKQLFPSKSSIDILTMQDTINLNVEYNDNIKLNEVQTFPFNISENYSPIILDENNQ